MGIPADRSPSIEDLSDNRTHEGKQMLASAGKTVEDDTAPAELPSSPAPKAGLEIGELQMVGHAQATAALVQAVEDEDWHEAEKRLSSPQGIDPNARTTDWDYAILRAAAEGGATETCRLLLDCKADVNGCDSNCMTAIMGCV